MQRGEGEGVGSASTGPRDAEITFLLPSWSSWSSRGAKHAEDVDPLAKDSPTEQSPRRDVLQKSTPHLAGAGQ